jgi:hypothetical protein
MIFFGTARYTLSDHQRNKEILVGLKIRPIEEKVGWYKSITTCNKNEQQQDTKNNAKIIDQMDEDDVQDFWRDY